MNKKTATVLYALVNLPDNELNELINEFNGYSNLSGSTVKSNFRENLRKRHDLGPVLSTDSGRCPLCGRR